MRFMLLCISAVLMIACLVLSRQAAGRTLRRFVPSDLEFEEPGVLAMDTAVGFVRGDNGSRISVPDFEFALGAADDLEFDVEGEFALKKTGDGALSFRRSAPDNLWTYTKLGLLSSSDTDTDDVWSFGMQAGPKLPVASGARGVGIEGVFLLAYVVHKTHFILNAGGLVDPASDRHTPRPAGLENGFSIDRALDAAQQWSASLDIASVTFLSPDPDQLNTSLTLTWSPSARLDVYVTGTYGWLKGGDQYGMLLGMVPRVRLW